jgi:Ca2+-binding EF-hand superfamily protein
MEEMDTNKDGRVDRDEFLAFLEKKFTLHPTAPKKR